jgi:hypothetical protein
MTALLVWIDDERKLIACICVDSIQSARSNASDVKDDNYLIFQDVYGPLPPPNRYLVLLIHCSAIWQQHLA